MKSAAPAMYANDTKITVHGKTETELEISLTRKLEFIQVWILANK